jgi:hypothetical protein
MNTKILGPILIILLILNIVVNIIFMNLGNIFDWIILIGLFVCMPLVGLYTIKKNEKYLVYYFLVMFILIEFQLILLLLKIS